MCFFNGFDNFGNVDPSNEELEVFHNWNGGQKASWMYFTENLRLAGLYLLSKVESSVKIPIWARSRLRPASSKPIISSKCPRRSYSWIKTESSSCWMNNMFKLITNCSVWILTAWTIILRPQIWAKRNSDFSMHAAWTCFQTLNAIKNKRRKREGKTPTECCQLCERSLQQLDSRRGKSG